LFSTVLYNLVFGELIQAKRDIESPKMTAETEFKLFDSENYFDSYI